MEEATHVDYTSEEMARACQIAEQEVLKRSEQFKPPKATAIKDEKAWCCEQTFMGAAGDDLVCSIKLQWNFWGGGCVHRVIQYVHARLHVLHNDQGRFLRLAGLHVAEWSKDPEHKHLTGIKSRPIPRCTNTRCLQNRRKHGQDRKDPWQFG